MMLVKSHMIRITTSHQASVVLRTRSSSVCPMRRGFLTSSAVKPVKGGGTTRATAAGPMPVTLACAARALRKMAKTSIACQRRVQSRSKTWTVITPSCANAECRATHATTEGMYLMQTFQSCKTGAAGVPTSARACVVVLARSLTLQTTRVRRAQSCVTSDSVHRRRKRLCAPLMSAAMLCC